MAHCNKAKLLTSFEKFLKDVLLSRALKSTDKIQNYLKKTEDLPCPAQKAAHIKGGGGWKMRIKD